MYRVSLLYKNDAVPSPRVVKLAVAFQLSGPGCHLGSRPGQVLVDVPYIQGYHCPISPHLIANSYRTLHTLPDNSTLSLPNLTQSHHTSSPTLTVRSTVCQTTQRYHYPISPNLTTPHRQLLPYAPHSPRQLTVIITQSHPISPHLIANSYRTLHTLPDNSTLSLPNLTQSHHTSSPTLTVRSTLCQTTQRYHYQSHHISPPHTYSPVGKLV